MVAIEPEVFDLIVAGTGLEESITAAAAAKAGKCVLHVDAASHYGSTWSSFTMDQFLDWTQNISHSSACILTANMPPRRQHAENRDLSNQSLYSTVQLHQQQADLGASRQYSIDLASKTIFCASETIDTLLMFGVQNYLDFKLFQGSYVFSDGKFISVPASRAAVFRDRTLSPADKRLLTRFLMQLANGHNSRPFTDASQPFASFLKAEGLSHNLRQFIMYAVAMADHDQEALEQQHTLAASQSPAASPPSKHATNSSAHLDKPPAQGNSRTFNQQHSFLQPGVKTASRQPVDAASTQQASSSSDHHQDTPASNASASRPQHQQPDDVHGASVSGSNDQQTDEVGEASRPSCGVPPIAVEMPEGLLSSEAGLAAMRQYLGSVGRHGPNTAALLTPMYGCGELPQAFCRVAAVHGALYILRQPLKRLLLDAGRRRCEGVETEQGQVLKCSAFAASSALLAGLSSPWSDEQEQQSESPQEPEQAAQQAGPMRLSKAICILDGSLQKGQSHVFVVIPPNSLPSRNPNAIRVLQLGPAAAVCPANRTLLYLSTPSTAPTASEDLRAAVSALAATSALFSTATEDQANGINTCQSEQPQAKPFAGAQPIALLVAFYNQTCQQENAAEGDLPENVAACWPPDGSISPDSAVRHAKQCFAKLYPESLSVFEPTTALSADEDSDDEALDALSSVLQGSDTA